MRIKRSSDISPYLPAATCQLFLLPDYVGLGCSSIAWTVGPPIMTEPPRSVFGYRSRSSSPLFVRVAIRMRRVRRRSPLLVPRGKIAITRRDLGDKRIWRIDTLPPVANTETATKLHETSSPFPRYVYIHTGFGNLLKMYYHQFHSVAPSRLHLRFTSHCKG